MTRTRSHTIPHALDVWVRVGTVERWDRNGRCRRIQGYALQLPSGVMCQPWKTRDEAQADSRANGMRATFRPE